MNELRLELVRLCYRHDSRPAEIAARARELEEFVLESGASAAEVTPTRRKQKAEQVENGQSAT